MSVSHDEKDWEKSTELAIGAIAGGIVSLTYWALGLLFAEAKANPSYIIILIVVWLLFLFWIFQNRSEKAFPIGKNGVPIILLMLVLSGIVPFLGEFGLVVVAIIAVIALILGLNLMGL